MKTCFTHLAREKQWRQILDASHGDQAPGFVRPLPTRPRGPNYLDRAPPEAVDSVGIRTGLQELPHSLHLPPRRGAGQARIAAATTEHDLVLFPHFAATGKNLARMIHCRR